MADTRSRERTTPARQENGSSSMPPITRPKMPVFYSLVTAGIVIAAVLVFVFPNLRSNVPFLALVTLTPLLGGLRLGLRLSGLGRRLPGQTQNLVRGALALVILLDLVVFAGPLFVRGATGQDTAPTFNTPVVQTSPTGAANGTSTTTASAPGVTRSGQFDHRPGVDTVAGAAILGTTSEGTPILRLENLNAANGPDLYVYLSKTPSPATREQVMNGIEVGKLKGTQGNFNYTLPATTEIGSYQSVVVYCKSFSRHLRLRQPQLA